jgi:adenosine 3'-phospho 5'-phosphosulfate transporter B3
MMGEKPDTSSYMQERYLRFYYLVAGILIFFGCHNFLQELIMSLPNFKVAVILAYLEVLGVTICSYIELVASGETIRKSPISSYLTLCFMLILSSAASNISLNYINYPTKVVFRSCKIIPTMSIATCLNNKRVYWFEYIAGALISVGMILFATAEVETSPNFNFIGIGLVSLSVIADAFLPNFQERVFEHGSSRVEVTFYTNVLCLFFMTISCFMYSTYYKYPSYFSSPLHVLIYSIDLVIYKQRYPTQ